jgi:pimeloyl-ACP methyl ester carboxylesterase
VDVFGYQGGSLAAIEFAYARPEQVRRVLLLGVPASDGGYQVGERLPLLRQPVTILRARDEFWESTARAETLLREAQRVDLTCPDAQVFDKGIDEVVQITREFLDR